MRIGGWGERTCRRSRGGSDTGDERMMMGSPCVSVATKAGFIYVEALCFDVLFVALLEM